MPPSTHRFALAALGLIGLLAGPAWADRDRLPDSTWVDRWTLPCGMRVVARHLPGVSTVSTTVCYGSGSRSDPSGREGLSELLAEVQLTARAGTIPERQLSELDALRPVGWSFKVSPRITELTEAAPLELFPSVLHQVCLRIRGVTVTETGLKNAMESTRDRLRLGHDTHADRALYFMVDELASGRPSEGALRFATGEGLDGVSIEDVKKQLAQRFAPNQGVLCVIGNFEGIDLHKLIGADLGDLPAAKPAPPIAWGGLASANGAIDRKDLDHPIGIVGIIAPALTDSLHPYFTALAFSAVLNLNRLWGKPEPPLTARFQYSVASDPELVRLYPPLRAGTLKPEEALAHSFAQTGPTIIDSTELVKACNSGLWLLGGPLPDELRHRAQDDPTVVHTLATTMAALERYGDAGFWADYRRRFLESPRMDMRPVLAYFIEPSHQASFLFKPPS